MLQTPKSQFRNLLLRKMRPEDWDILRSAAESVDLETFTVLESPGKRVEHVYFVEEGMLSIVSKMNTRRDVEVGVVGKEGMSGIAVVLGDEVSSLETNVQITTTAIRLPVPVLQDAILRSRTLLDLLLLYARSLDLQTASTASANGRAKLEERLARWLLMTHDRVDSDRINITHEFLAKMLACRRPGVTVGLHLLEGKGYIRSNRGQIVMLNRSGLEEEANGSYGFAELEYERLLGEDFRHRGNGNDGKPAPRLSLVATLKAEETD